MLGGGVGFMHNWCIDHLLPEVLLMEEVAQVLDGRGKRCKEEVLILIEEKADADKFNPREFPTLRVSLHHSSVQLLPVGIGDWKLGGSHERNVLFALASLTPNLLPLLTLGRNRITLFITAQHHMLLHRFSRRRSQVIVEQLTQLSLFYTILLFDHHSHPLSPVFVSPRSTHAMPARLSFEMHDYSDELPDTEFVGVCLHLRSILAFVCLLSLISLLFL